MYKTLVAEILIIPPVRSEATAVPIVPRLNDDAREWIEWI